MKNDKKVGSHVLSTHVLLKFNENWADEFDVEGFIALPTEEWKEYKKQFKEAIGDGSFDYGFGTNQELTFNDADHYLSCFKQSNISEEEYNFLLKNFEHTDYREFDGKNFKSIVKIAQHGTIPFYSPEEIKEIKEGIAERKEQETQRERGRKDAKAGIKKSSKDPFYIEGYEDGERRKKYGY